jgi:hypothetical protein
VGAKIDLNESVDSSVDAFCHARKIGPQSPISNGRQIAHSNSNIARMLATLVKTGRQLARTQMEQIALYKDIRIRAYQDWAGQWLAEAKRPFDANPEYIATPFPHPTPEAAVDLVKRLIDGEGTQGSSQTKPSNEDNSGSAMLAALRAEFPAHLFDNVPRKRE